MDTKRYPVDISVTVAPIWHNDPPEIKVYVNDVLLSHDRLTSEKTYQYLGKLSGNNSISIEFLNKQDSDTQGNLDKAVEITDISFMGISSKNFVWAGKYYPIYPEPWATEQMLAGTAPAESLTYQTRLSWNGVWRLDFSVPVFTWIHQVENLGWIYD